MREAVGSTWIIGLVLVFILIFSSYLALTISYQKTFKLKNEVLSFIEREEGLTSPADGHADSAMSLINNYLTNSGYHNKGICPANWLGVKELSSNPMKGSDYVISNGDGTKYYYCVLRNSIKTGSRAKYYKIRLFYKFDLPVIGDVVTFEVDGETNDVVIPGDDMTWSF